MSSSLPDFPSTGRVLGVDNGTHRIGVALSDPRRVLAQPLTTMRSRGEGADVEALVEIARQHEVVGIVVGLPVNMDGSRGPACEASERLMEALRRASGLPVRGWDERLTSVQAERSLRAAGLRASRRRQKGIVDRVAAALILESFLAALEADACEGPRDDKP
jgi:putative Holliday junction resolvase